MEPQTDHTGPEFKQAIRLALSERRLWPAAFLSALAFTEAWWILFGWGPERFGRRAANTIHLPRGIEDIILFITVATAAFIILRAVGYLGEMVLIRQVGSNSREIPSFGKTVAESQKRYVPFAVTFLPWDALRIAVIYLPAIFIPVWERLDPGYNHFILYFLVLITWSLLLLAVYVVGGLLAMLAVRSSTLKEKDFRKAWREAWVLFRTYPSKSFTIWFQAVLADVFFLLLAWPLSALIPWAVNQFVHGIGFAPLRSLIYFIEYALLVVGFLVGQIAVQCYKSSLWTISFAGFRREVLVQEEQAVAARRKASFEPPIDFMPPEALT
ncbi:MAG: hypothetical protein A2Y75_03445 [Candidatus Solincola sediminis]|uniref:Uncharacterized protein n=1 Tax=Candidatus Solincola sediminis TaxID=1797199 RepID=A0A1F2WH90_9ACTN|nr:MAG: hypothetical protein A2Y75_03445 [Candidatus Solincola sediminis]